MQIDCGRHVDLSLSRDDNCCHEGGVGLARTGKVACAIVLHSVAFQA